MLLKVIVGIDKLRKYIFPDGEEQPSKAPNNTPPENNGDKPGVPGANPPVNAILPSNKKDPEEEDKNIDPKKGDDGGKPDTWKDNCNDLKDKFNKEGATKGDKEAAWNEWVGRNNAITARNEAYESSWLQRGRENFQKNRIMNAVAKDSGYKNYKDMSKSIKNDIAKEAGFKNAREMQRAVRQAEREEKRAEKNNKNAGISGTGMKGLQETMPVNKEVNGQELGDNGLTWAEEQIVKWNTTIVDYSNAGNIKITNEHNYLNKEAPDQQKMADTFKSLVKDGVVLDAEKFKTEFLYQFNQNVGKGEDIADKIQRVIDTENEKIKEGNFSSLIPEDFKKSLSEAFMNTKNLSKEERYNEINKVVTDIKNYKEEQNGNKNLTKTEKAQVEDYVAGLQYMMDNKDTAAAAIGAQACAIIADYVFSAMTNPSFDIAKTNFEQFYQDKFEKGNLGISSNLGAPVVNKSAYSPRVNSTLWFDTIIEDKEASIRIKPDLNGNSGKPAIDCLNKDKFKQSLIDYNNIKYRVEELNNKINKNNIMINQLNKTVSGKNSSMENAMKVGVNSTKLNNDIEKYERYIQQYDNLEEKLKEKGNDLKNITESNQNAYLVIKKESHDATHFFIVAKTQDGLYRTFDFTSPGTIGDIYDKGSSPITDWRW